MYKGTLERVSFPNYENFDNADNADIYTDFIAKLDCVTNAIAPFKTAIIKNNASEWFRWRNCREKIHTRQTVQKKLNQQNYIFFFSYLGFLSQPFTNHRTAG